MSTDVRSVPAAATGACFAIVLFVANGQGGTLSAPRDVASTVALTLLIPFAVHLAALLRVGASTATDAWLAMTAAAAGVSGAVIKLMSDAPQVALSQAGVASRGQTGAALTAIADATTLLALFPLALFGLAVGACALRSGVLPAWLGVGAVITGASLAVNGCFRGTENVPALLVLSLWCLLASAHLVRAALRGRATTGVRSVSPA